MERTWKPKVAGILAIIAGVTQVIMGLVIVGLGGFFIPWGVYAGAFMTIPAAYATPLIILGITAIVGGIYALRRRIWKLALAGSVCALPVMFPLLGIPAILFVIMGKGEFK